MALKNTYSYNKPSSLALYTYEIPSQNKSAHAFHYTFDDFAIFMIITFNTSLPYIGAIYHSCTSTILFSFIYNVKNMYNCMLSKIIIQYSVVSTTTLARPNLVLQGFDLNFQSCMQILTKAGSSKIMGSLTHLLNHMYEWS